MEVIITTKFLKNLFGFIALSVLVTFLKLLMTLCLGEAIAPSMMVKTWVVILLAAGMMVRKYFSDIFAAFNIKSETYNFEIILRIINHTLLKTTGRPCMNLK